MEANEKLSLHWHSKNQTTAILRDMKVKTLFSKGNYFFVNTYTEGSNELIRTNFTLLPSVMNGKMYVPNSGSMNVA
jgi:hypothetical protein